MNWEFERMNCVREEALICPVCEDAEENFLQAILVGTIQVSQRDICLPYEPTIVRATVLQKLGNGIPTFLILDNQYEGILAVESDAYATDLALRWTVLPSPSHLVGLRTVRPAIDWDWHELEFELAVTYPTRYTDIADLAESGKEDWYVTALLKALSFRNIHPNKKLLYQNVNDYWNVVEPITFAVQE